MASRQPDGPIESDRYEGAPHPREVHACFGHEAAERQLLDAYRSGRMPPAWLIGGPEGIGKATLAWRLARFVLAHPDRDAAAVKGAADLGVDASHPAARLIHARAHGDVSVLRREWNEKSRKPFTEIRVDDVRKVLHRFQHAAAAGGFRIAIVDTADDLNRASANALLKIIEEPPDEAMFLILAHRPEQVLPTIRSRCRILSLRPLELASLEAAVLGLGEPWSDTEPAILRRAAVRAQGSVRQCLRLLTGDALALLEGIGSILAALPKVDGRKLHALCDALEADGSDDSFAMCLEAILDWLAARLQDSAPAGRPASRLAPFAEVWDKVTAAAREAESLNLDRRPLLLTMVADLAAAAEAGAR
jgi:DNA polymerase-3 subunit delta'